MAHVHTGHGPNKMSDCPGCETEYHESRSAEIQRSIENQFIAEWFRKNAPNFVEKFLSETYPKVSD